MLTSLVKNIMRYFSLKEIIIACLAIIVSVTAGVGVFFFLEKDVAINDDGTQIVARTMKNTVEEVLTQNKVPIKSCDYISMPLNTELQRMKVNEINIKRAVPVNVIADGKEISVMTYKDTVGEMLKDSPLKPEGLDKLVGARSDDKIKKGMTVQIVRVKEDIETESEPIPFQRLKKANNKLDEGTEKVVQDGKDGVREKQYKVVYEDGNEVTKKLVNDFVALTPVNMITEFGTILNHKTARGDVIRYKKVLDMRATAYTSSFKDTGKHPGDPEFGITYTGIVAKKGVIAVDPKVIPLGTRVYVEVAGSTPDYGYAVAADTGGAIKGNLIDLYFDDQGFVDRWGCKRVKVYILLSN